MWFIKNTYHYGSALSASDALKQQQQQRPFNGLFSTWTLVGRHQESNTIMEQGMIEWQWHRLDHMQIIFSSLQTDNHASTSSLNFHSVDALSDAQPTV